jgi:hypothetical protein
MILASILLLNGVCTAASPPVLENAMPVRVTGAWTVEIGPGAVTVGGVEDRIGSAVSLEIAAPEIIQVRDECHPALPLFNKNAGGWMRGAKLSRLIAEECTSTGLLFPETVRLKPAPGGASPFTLDKDYILDGFWANFGRAPESSIAARQSVFVDYNYSPSRIDSILSTRPDR